MELKVKCPTCGASTVYSVSNPYRPFCSERCRILDLGQWANESYRVPHTPAESDEDEQSLSDLEKKEDDPEKIN